LVLAQAEGIRAAGLARAEGYRQQVGALGAGATALVNVANSVSEGHVKVAPDVLVTGGGGGSLEGVLAQIMGSLSRGGHPIPGVPTMLPANGEADPEVEVEPEPGDDEARVEDDTPAATDAEDEVAPSTAPAPIEEVVNGPEVPDPNGTT